MDEGNSDDFCGVHGGAKLKCNAQQPKEARGFRITANGDGDKFTIMSLITGEYCSLSGGDRIKCDHHIEEGLGDEEHFYIESFQGTDRFTIKSDGNLEYCSSQNDIRCRTEADDVDDWEQFYIRCADPGHPSPDPDHPLPANTFFDIRLAGENAYTNLHGAHGYYSGRIEIRRQRDGEDAEWSTVCARPDHETDENNADQYLVRPEQRFTEADAKVACRMLGYPHNGAYPVYYATAGGEGSSATTYRKPGCVGTEVNFGDCADGEAMSPIPMESGTPQQKICNHLADVGVMCTDDRSQEMQVLSG